MWAFYAASFLVGLTSSQSPAIFDSKEYTRETSCMWPWAKQIGTPDNLKGKLLRAFYFVNFVSSFSENISVAV